MVAARNEEQLRRTLAGIEAPRFTEVVPNRRLRQVIRLMDTREPLDFAENEGTYDGWYTFEQGPVTVAGTAEGPLSYEDFGYWLLHGVSGDDALATVTGDGGTPAAYVRPFIPTPDEDDLASSTMQHGAPDNVYVSTGVMVPEFTIRGDIDDAPTWQWSSRLVARTRDPLVAGFEDPVAAITHENIKTAGTRIKIADTAAGLAAATPLSNQAISFSVTWNNNVTSKRFLENEDAMAEKVGRGVRQITGQVRLEFEDDVEYEHYRSGDVRAIQIYRDGSVIHDAVTKRAEITIPRGYWLTPSDDPRENNMTMTFGFRAYVDTTLAYPAQIRLINTVASYPAGVAA